MIGLQTTTNAKYYLDEYSKMEQNLKKVTPRWIAKNEEGWYTFSEDKFKILVMWDRNTDKRKWQKQEGIRRV